MSKTKNRIRKKSNNLTDCFSANVMSRIDELVSMYNPTAERREEIKRLEKILRIPNVSKTSRYWAKLWIASNRELIAYDRHKIKQNTSF